MSSYYQGTAGPAGSASYTGSPWSPSDAGFIAWNGDINHMLASFTSTSGRLYLSRIRLGRTQTCTGGSIYIATAGNTLTSGQNLMGLFDTSGTKLATSTDQTTAWGSTGFKDCAWSSAITSLAAGDYFVAFLSVGSQAARPTRMDDDNANGRLTAPLSSLRSLRTVATNLTALPASVDFSGSYVAEGTCIWMGLY